MSSDHSPYASQSPVEKEEIIRIRGLNKIYRLYDKHSLRMREALHPLGKIYHRKFYALRNMDLSVGKGEILGIVGRNGAGKSTLLQILSGVLEPTSGVVDVKGKITALLELGTGFNPELTGLENIYFHGTIKGIAKAEMDKLLEDILDFAGIGDFINQPLKTYSSGMRARLGFALASHMDPQILILDEVLSVGDVLFKRKCFAKMEEVFQAGCTVIYVSHATNSINEICSRAILLDRGELILDGPPRLITTYYQRMLFDESYPDEKIRREILELNRDQAAKEAFFREIQHIQPEDAAAETTAFDPDDDGDHTRAIFVPGFKASSTIITRNAEVDIQDVRIQTVSGNIVNFLVPNEEYHLCFRAVFREEFEKVILGFRIKSLRGTKLLTARLNPGDKPLRGVKGGEVVDVDCRWTCNLLHGTYSIDLRVTTPGRECNLATMISDALVFKVQKTELGSQQSGVVFLNHKASVNRSSFR